MTVPFDVQLRKVSEPLIRSRSCNVLTLHHASKCVRDFDIQQMGCMETGGRLKNALHQTARKTGLQQRFKESGGVNDDQRLSRSARMISVGRILPL